MTEPMEPMESWKKNNLPIDFVKAKVDRESRERAVRRESFKQDPKGERLFFAIRYKGPFNRLTDWCYAVNPFTHESWKEIKDDSLRSRCGDFMERLDRLWTNWYLRRGTEPSRRWSR